MGERRRCTVTPAHGQLQANVGSLYLEEGLLGVLQILW
jgi:hypothetical protein